MSTKHFKVEELLFNDSGFTVAYGVWHETPNNKSLASRWKSFPADWVLIHESLKVPFISALINVDESDKAKILEALKLELK